MLLQTENKKLEFNKLVAFGCSHTFGSESFNPGDHYSDDCIYGAYPYFLSEQLGIPVYINKARPGASNLEIAHKVIDYTINNDCTNTIFIIGWSSDTRFPIMQKRKYNTIKLIRNRFLFTKQTKQFDLFHDFMSLYFFDTPLNTTFNALVKLCTSVILEKQNVTYLTLPTFIYNNHSLFKYITKSNNILSYDDNNEIIFDFLKYKLDKNDSIHLTHTEHKILSIFLYKHIVKHLL